MLLTIRTTHQPATDLGFLLHKHPEHVHTREFPFGKATVFYPEASEESCTAAVLLDVDPVGIVRGRGRKGGCASNTRRLEQQRGSAWGRLWPRSSRQWREV